MHLRKSCYIPMAWEFITIGILWLKGFLNNSYSSRFWGSVVSSRPDIKEKKPQHRTVLGGML